MRRLLVLAALLFACDQPARSGDGASATVANPSRELESCARSADCEAPLRCVGQVCRRPGTSRLGEFHWTVGRAALDKPGPATAAEAMLRAVAQFESDKVEVPAALLCDAGAALRRNTADARSGEQAARLLHRCLLLAPPGSPEHGAALRELVELEAVGLEPALLGRDTAVDTYLVRAPKRPSFDALKVDVAQTEVAHDRGYAAWIDVLKGPDAHPVLVRCFEAYFVATSKPQLRFMMPLKLSAVIGDDDLYVGGTLELGVDSTLSGAEASAAGCVRDGLATLAKELAKKGSSGSWAGAVTITLQSP